MTLERTLVVIALLWCAPVHAQEDESCRPAGECKLQSGFSMSVYGMSGLFIPPGISMHPAPGDALPTPLEGVDFTLEGAGPYLGTGARFFFQGRIARAGVSGGVYQLDHGLAIARGVPSGEVHLDKLYAWGGHVEAFGGGELDLRPLYPYADLAMWVDIVQTRYRLSTSAQGKLGTTALNAYNFGIGPRIGVIVPVSSNMFLDLAATGGVIGANRLSITAGLGFQTAPRPPFDGCDSHCR